MTLIIRVPSKLAKRTGLNDLPTLPAATNPLCDWSVGFFEYGQSEYLLLANTMSLYVELIKITPTVAGNLEQALFDTIERLFRDTPYQENFEKFIRPQRGNVAYSKTLSRVVTGRLNRMAFEISCRLDYEMSLEEINASIKREIYEAVHESGKTYNTAAEVFTQINESKQKEEVCAKKVTPCDQSSKSVADESSNILKLEPPQKNKGKKKLPRPKKKTTSHKGNLSDGDPDRNDDFPDIGKARREGEAAMRNLAKNLSSGKFTIDHIKELLQGYMTGVLDGVSQGKLTADDLLDEVESIDDPEEAKRIIQKALTLDPKSIRAYHLLALHCANTVEEIRKYLETGERIGNELFPDGMQEQFDGNLWYLMEARPYLLLLNDLAVFEHRFENVDKARTIYEKILRLSEGDNLGIRYKMIFLLIELNRDADAEKLYKHYDERSASWLYARALLDYRQDGPTSKNALASLKKAKKENPYFAKMCGSTAEF
ncbi:MAG: hypothetical protein PHQ75_00815, partial [Thermoguttaceae bacterium]|nr:hypothetical protein [Thermoguttaceae bacterium]